MVTSQAPTVEHYLASLPAERRSALAAVRAVIRSNLRPGFEEGMQYGMIGYYLPLARYPETYNGQPLCLAGLASQKNHMAVYLMSVYGHRETRRWFEDACRKAGKKLDMGKSCVRFRSLDQLALPVVGQAVKRVTPAVLIAQYEAGHSGPARRTVRSGRAAPPRPKPVARKAVASKPGKKANGKAGRKRPRTDRA